MNRETDLDRDMLKRGGRRRCLCESGRVTARSRPQKEDSKEETTRKKRANEKKGERVGRTEPMNARMVVQGDMREADRAP